MAHDVGCKAPRKVPADVIVYAEFAGTDDCYRIRLSHEWESGKGTVMFAMMNPSAAAIKWSDSTVDKCRKFARRWGFKRLLVGNAMAYRSTQQAELLKVKNPCGSRYNWPALRRMAREADMIVIAHGRLPKRLQKYGRKMSKILKKSGTPVYALRVSKKDNNPWHPLYLAGDTRPRLWRGYKVDHVA